MYVAVVKVRGNAGDGVPGPLKLLGSVPGPNTGVSGTNRLRRAPNFSELMGPKFIL